MRPPFPFSFVHSSDLSSFSPHAARRLVREYPGPRADLSRFAGHSVVGARGAGEDREVRRRIGYWFSLCAFSSFVVSCIYLHPNPEWRTTEREAQFFRLFSLAAFSVDLAAFFLLRRRLVLPSFLLPPSPLSPPYLLTAHCGGFRLAQSFRAFAVFLTLVPLSFSSALDTLPLPLPPFASSSPFSDATPFSPARCRRQFGKHRRSLADSLLFSRTLTSRQ